MEINTKLKKREEEIEAFKKEVDSLRNKNKKLKNEREEAEKKN
jgi:hypothetical protein